MVCGALQGMLFGIVVLTAKRFHVHSNKYLAKMVIFISLNNLYYWLIETKIVKGLAIYEFLYIPWSLLILPMIYLFLRSYLKVETEKRYIYAIKIPFYFFLVIYILLLLLFVLWREWLVENEQFKLCLYDFEEYFSIVYSCLLIFMSLKTIRNYQTKNKIQLKKNESVPIRWLKKLLWAGSVICCLWFLVIAISGFFQDELINLNIQHLIWLSISVIIYWIGYLGLVKPDILFQQKLEHINSDSDGKRRNQQNLSYTKFAEIDRVIKDELLYLDPNLSLESLSARFELSTGYLSQMFNVVTGNSFTNYINSFRIECAKKMLLDKKYKNYTILAIGLEAGFNSKSAFYKAFKRFERCSPTTYKAQFNVS